MAGCLLSIQAHQLLGFALLLLFGTVLRTALDRVLNVLFDFVLVPAIDTVCVCVCAPRRQSSYRYQSFATARSLASDTTVPRLRGELVAIEELDGRHSTSHEQEVYVSVRLDVGRQERLYVAGTGALHELSEQAAWRASSVAAYIEPGLSLELELAHYNTSRVIKFLSQCTARRREQD